MEKKDAKEPEFANEDNLDQYLDQFENEDKLNLTSDERDKDEAIDPEVEKDFQNFLKNLNQEGGEGGEGETMENLSKLMANLMGGMKMDGNNAPGEDGPDPQFQKIFQNLMGCLDDNNLDSATDNFLAGVMEKDLLLEPLTEAKKHYETYLEENKGKLNETDTKNYTEQYNCIIQLLEVLDTDPNNKQKLIGLFEKMHEYGPLPQGILNPFESQIPGAGGNMPGFPPGGFPGGFPGGPGGFGGFPGGPGGFPGAPPGGDFSNMKPEDIQKQMEGCNMF